MEVSFSWCKPVHWLYAITFAIADMSMETSLMVYGAWEAGVEPVTLITSYVSSSNISYIWPTFSAEQSALNVADVYSPTAQTWNKMPLNVARICTKLCRKFDEKLSNKFKMLQKPLVSFYVSDSHYCFTGSYQLYVHV